MPLKTNIGISRKVADNNYGSRGASVNLEVELDSGLIQEPERLQDRIRQVFRLAQQSVDEELARQTTANGHDNGHASANNGNGNGHHDGNGNGQATPRRSNARKATASQARALRSIADRHGLDLAAELQQRFGVNEPEQLNITEASGLIDELKGSTNGSSKGEAITLIAQIEPRIAIPPTGRDYLSFSAIRLYQTCPLKFFFKYHLGLPEETVSSSLVLGSAVHRAIEFHFRELLSGNPPPSSPAIFAEFSEEWNSRDLGQVRFNKGEDRESLEVVGVRILSAFQRSAVAQPSGQILAVEEELRGPVVPGCPDILGRVDLIVDTGSELVVSDWKTARSKWSHEQAEDAAEQLILYSELAKDFAPGKRVMLEFVILTKMKDVAIDRHLLPVDPAQVTRTKRVVENVWRAIDTGCFYPAPSPMNCPSCPYRRECREWKG